MSEWNYWKGRKVRPGPLSRLMVHCRAHSPASGSIPDATDFVNDRWMRNPLGAGTMPVRIDEITIDPEFSALMRRQTEEERKQLLLSVEREGRYREKLIVWQEYGILLDGQSRLELYRDCHEDDTISPPEIEEISLPTRDVAKLWIVRNQLARRNLGDFERAQLALMLAPAVKQKAAEKQREGGAAKVPQNYAEPIDTRKEVAAIAGVSHETVRKVKSIVEHAPPAVVEAVRKGEVSINKAHQSIAGVKAPTVKAPTAREPDRELPSTLKTALAAIVRKWPTATLDDFAEQVVSLVGVVLAAEKLRRGE
jgi:hypothetical protein